MNKKKDKKLKVRFVPNNDISEGEEQAIWNDVFDLLLKEKPKRKNSLRKLPN